MSPSEDQLRAALRAGEGATPDPDAIIGRALHVRYQRHQRRMRVAGVAAAVVVVGGLGFSLTLGSGDNGGSAGSNAAGSANTAVIPSAAATANLPAAGHQNFDGSAASAVPPAVLGAGEAQGGGISAGSSAGCPSTPVRYALPGGGGTNQFGASSSLFSGAVTAIVVCRYDPTVGGTLTSADSVSGADAAALARQLDNSPVTGNSLLCLTPLRLELIPADADDMAMTPISVVGECNEAMVTNGTQVRYVPLSVFGLTPTAPATNQLQPGGGAMSGSPPR